MTGITADGGHVRIDWPNEPSGIYTPQEARFLADAFDSVGKDAVENAISEL